MQFSEKVVDAPALNSLKERSLVDEEPLASNVTKHLYSRQEGDPDSPTWEQRVNTGSRLASSISKNSGLRQASSIDFVLQPEYALQGDLLMLWK